MPNRMGHYAEARAIYGQLHRDGYRSFAMLTNLANLLVRAGDYREALVVLNEVLTRLGVPEEAEARIRQNIAFLESKLDRD